MATTYVTDKIAPLKQSVTVDVITTDAGPCSANTAYASGHRIIVCAASGVWLGTTPFQRVKILVHEYFHIIQFELGAAGTAPTWLLEGSAEFIGYAAIVDNGTITLDRAKVALGLNRGLSRLPPVAPLESLETQAAAIQANGERKEPTYSLFYAAVEALVAQSGIESLRTFFAGLRGGDWRPLFASVFGQSVESFYSDFTQLRSG